MQQLHLFLHLVGFISLLSMMHGTTNIKNVSVFQCDSCIQNCSI